MAKGELIDLPQEILNTSTELDFLYRLKAGELIILGSKYWEADGVFVGV